MPAITLDFVFLAFACLAAVLFLRNAFKKFSHRFFPALYTHLSQRMNDCLVVDKLKLFNSFCDLKSSDEALRKKNSIRILELGAGPGNNFKFYPKDSRIIIVEPNPYFDGFRDQNLSRVEGLTVERTLTAFGEDMSAIEDNCVDAVVATMVLCSVPNVHLVLKEICRVLRPGGRYYFLEHGYGERNWKEWLLQHAVQPLWQAVFGGCRLTKDTIIDIKFCNLFCDVSSWSIPPKTINFAGTILGSFVLGIAVKAR